MNVNEEKMKTVLSFLKSLLHGTNKRILNLLEKEKELDIVRIANELKTNNSIVRPFLLELRDCGILLTRREDRSVLYSINQTFHEDLLKTIDEIFATDNNSKETF